MTDKSQQILMIPAPPPPRQSEAHWAERIWRPAGTLLAVLLALLVTWHVIDGKDGLSAWQKKRVEEKHYQLEIERLQKENAGLRDRIQHLQSDPDAIEHEAREQLHYARPGEVIYALPAEPRAQTSAPAR